MGRLYRALDLATQEEEWVQKSPQGYAGLLYRFDTTIYGAIDPADGELRFNNSDHSQVTKVVISYIEATGASVSSLLVALTLVTGGVYRGGLFIRSIANPEKFRFYQIIEASNTSTARVFDVEFAGGQGTLTDDEEVSVEIFRYGNKGDTGTGLPTGTTPGETAYFNGTNWVILAPPSANQILGEDSGLPAWVAKPPLPAWVPLGRESGTSVSHLTFDNIFDDALYSTYRIIGQMRPATDAVSWTANLRTGTPSNVGGGLRCGGAYGRLDAAGSGTIGNNTVLGALIGNAAGAGITSFQFDLHMRDGYRHGFIQSGIHVQTGGARYFISYSGEFLDTTPRQGIRFTFSSGNIADGWIEVEGKRKQ